MANEKFTPGPWNVTTGTHTESTDTYDEGDVWFNVNGEDGAIADVLHSRCLPAEVEEAEANAHLIAAAPAMYEALKGVADFFKSEVGNGGWIYKVREALAAANPETKEI